MDEIYLSKHIFSLACTTGGKYLLGVDKKYKITKITSNSVHYFTGERTKEGLPVYQARIWPNDQILDIFIPILTKMDLANQYKPLRNKYDSFLHFSGLEEKNWKYPSIFLTTTTITPTGGAANAEGSLQSTPNGTFSSARTGGGSGAVETNPTAEFAYFIQDGGSGTNFYIQRWYFKIDYTSLSTAAVIQSLSWNYYCRDGGGGAGTNELTFTKSTHSNTLVGTDWNNTDTTQVARQSSDTLGTPATQLFTLNGAISDVIPGTSILKYKAQANDDYDNVTPANNFAGYPILKTSTYATTNQRPVMVVTYTLPSGFLNFL